VLDDLLERAAALKGQERPFVLATVVACRPPTSAKPGARAIIQPDGSFYGWVGGSCAQPLVTQEALKALQEGQTRLVLLAPDPTAVNFPLENVVPVTMACQSEGTLAIYLEPFLPRPQLLVIGPSPMARSLAALGKALGFSVSACDPSASQELFPDAGSLFQDLESAGRNIRPGSYVAVATMGHYDEEALESVVDSQARYVGLVASPRRGRAVMEYLKGKGLSPEALQKVKYPAGLDIGAVTAEEIALSILTEIVQVRRTQGEGIRPELTAPANQTSVEDSLDPVCGMSVRVSEARYVSTHDSNTFYFCCRRCQEEFDRQPEKYLAGSNS
jgi:xanthine dehydrogenase accessory factor